MIFAILLALATWWVLSVLAEKDQLDPQNGRRSWRARTGPRTCCRGLWATLQAAFVSVIIALPVGALLGVARMSDHAWIRWPVGVIVEFFRSIPVHHPDAVRLPAVVRDPRTSSPFAAVVIGLVLYNGSVLAEVFRAGILAVPKGQTEAALAIGLNKTQLMTIVLLPQAITSMLPAVVSQLVVIVKDTALGGILVGYVELRRAANTSASFYGNLLPTYLVVAVIYIVINLALGYLSIYPGTQAPDPSWRRQGRQDRRGRAERPDGRQAADRGPGSAWPGRVPQVTGLTDRAGRALDAAGPAAGACD